MTKISSRWTFYVFTMGLTLALLMGVLSLGSSGDPVQAIPESSWLQLFADELSKNAGFPITQLLIQILAILAFSRICAKALKRVGQPQVVGEMIAGLLLGKSAFAWLWPSGFTMLFPESSMPRLYLLSQIGLIFFMFVVGLKLRISELRNQASTAVLVSHVSIVVPFVFGAIVSLGLYPRYGGSTSTFSSFALFMGIAMSITAFPMLARIIHERKLNHTHLGTMAITCAAVDDVSAWCVLAAVLGIVKAGTLATAGCILLLALVYVALMVKAVKPLLHKILQPDTQTGRFTNEHLAIVFFTVLASSLVSEIIGIHALFGAFIAGAVMPQHMALRSHLIEKVEDLSSIVLLPLFFAYTGIRTQINLIDTWQAGCICLGIVGVAIAGKMLGSAFAARWSGMPWHESWALGALMNTRGLMELIVLNIGYDLGILSPTIFAMMVIMAIVTTVMTGPMLSLFLKENR